MKEDEDEDEEEEVEEKEVEEQEVEEEDDEGSGMIIMLHSAKFTFKKKWSDGRTYVKINKPMG